MARRVSVGKRLADDREKRGIDALFGSPPLHQPTSTPVQPKKYEKATFYFDPDDLALLEKVWLRLMEQKVRCNKSEIVSILLRAGLEAHEQDPADSILRQQLTGKRRRS